MPLGFTFSFPSELRSIASAVLIEWNKNFNCSGVVGKDVVVLLHAAIKKIKVIFSKSDCDVLRELV